MPLRRVVDVVHRQHRQHTGGYQREQQENKKQTARDPAGPLRPFSWHGSSAPSVVRSETEEGAVIGAQHIIEAVLV